MEEICNSVTIASAGGVTEPDCCRSSETACVLKVILSRITGDISTRRNRSPGNRPAHTPRSAIDCVVAGPAKDRVIARIPVDAVIARATINEICASRNRIPGRIRESKPKHVIATATRNRQKVGNSRTGVEAECACRIAIVEVIGLISLHRRRIAGEFQRVIRRPSILETGISGITATRPPLDVAIDVLDTHIAVTMIGQHYLK